jgi:hypothetical protein
MSGLVDEPTAENTEQPEKLAIRRASRGLTDEPAAEIVSVVSHANKTSRISNLQGLLVVWRPKYPALQ